jgi:hypothetical protein
VEAALARGLARLERDGFGGVPVVVDGLGLAAPLSDEARSYLRGMDGGQDVPTEAANRARTIGEPAGVSVEAVLSVALLAGLSAED